MTFTLSRMRTKSGETRWVLRYRSPYGKQLRKVLDSWYQASTEILMLTMESAQETEG